MPLFHYLFPVKILLLQYSMILFPKAQFKESRLFIKMYPLSPISAPPTRLFPVISTAHSTVYFPPFPPGSEHRKRAFQPLRLTAGIAEKPVFFKDFSLLF